MVENNVPGKTAKAKETVLHFIQAINEEDFDEAKKYVSDALTFVGVLGTRKGTAAYFSDMEKMKFKYEVLKAFVDGDDVCLLYNIDMGAKTIFAAGWYQLVDEKINTFQVVFDPRPLL